MNVRVSTAAVCVGALALIARALVATACLAAAVVGQTSIRTIEVARDASLEALKSQYRRPVSIPFPSTNPYTPVKASLGKKLFFDPRLSKRQTESCATCHSPAFDWSDGMARALGEGVSLLDRRSPAILNTAWGEAFMWDGRADTLEVQALGPIQQAREMNMSLSELVERLHQIKDYEPLFAEAFPGERITPDTVARAIATFERTVISDPSPFDAWIDGDETAISDAAKSGFMLFNTKAGCSSCHEGWLFTNDGFQDIGLPTTDVGRGHFMPQIPKMLHAFKTPGLRDAALRGPYMHDGSLPTLEAVVDHYDRGGIDRPSRSDLIKPLGLTDQEKANLITFIKTLARGADPTSIPALPR